MRSPGEPEPAPRLNRERRCGRLTHRRAPCTVLRSMARRAKPKDPEARAGDGTYERIYAVVRRIPRGRIATYGQVAALAGMPRHARQVGYALHALGSDSDVPWHRVVNARGEVSPRAVPGWAEVQRDLLEAEDVEMARGRIDLARYAWKPARRVAPGAGRSSTRGRRRA